MQKAFCESHSVCFSLEYMFQQAEAQKVLLKPPSFTLIWEIY